MLASDRLKACQQCAEKVKAYWAKKGYRVFAEAARVVQHLPAMTVVVDGVPIHLAAVTVHDWEVVSDLHNGLPRGYRGEVAA
jgi:hypothetical protein